MSVQEKKETLHAAKPRFHVTGVSFDGYQVKRDGEQAAESTEDVNFRQEDEQELLFPDSGSDVLEKWTTESAERTDAYIHVPQRGPNAAVRPHALAPQKKQAESIFAGRDMKGKVYPKQAQIWGQGKKLPEPVQTWEEPEPVQEETTQEEKLQRVWDVWSAVIHAGDRKKAETHKRMDRETLIRKCNVRTAETPEGVTGKQELAEQSVLESEEEEPWVCSEEQREAIKKKKADKEGKKQTSDFGEDRESDEGKKKRRTDRTKRRMLREYVIHEIVH